MKKFLMGLVMAFVALTVSAQNVVEKYDTPKFFDNTYITVNGGVATPTTNHAFFKDLNANAGIRVGKDISPIFGVAIGSNAYFSEFGKQSNESGLVVKYLNTAVLAKVDVLNIFKTKLDRKFNLAVLAGPGWGHDFVTKGNDVTANFAINAGYNLTNRLAVYVEPALIYGLQDVPDRGLEFNINRSIVQLNAGLVYRFGKTKFTKTKYVALSEHDAIVRRLNEELAKKPREVVVEKEKIVEKVIEKNTTNDQTIGFVIGKADLTDASQSAIASIVKATEGKQVLVTGYASMDNYKFNDQLAKDRAEAVKKALIKAGKPEAEIETKSGWDAQPFGTAEANRCAIVTVK